MLYLVPSNPRRLNLKKSSWWDTIKACSPLGSVTKPKIQVNLEVLEPLWGFTFLVTSQLFPCGGAGSALMAKLTARTGTATPGKGSGQFWPPPAAFPSQLLPSWLCTKFPPDTPNIHWKPLGQAWQPLWKGWTWWHIKTWAHPLYQGKNKTFCSELKNQNIWFHIHFGCRD